MYYYQDGAVNKKGRLGKQGDHLYNYFSFLGETLFLKLFYIMFLAVCIMLAGLSVVQLVCLLVGQLVNNEFQGRKKVSNVLIGGII